MKHSKLLNLLVLAALFALPGFAQAERGLFVSSSATCADYPEPENNFSYCLPSTGDDAYQLMVYTSGAWARAIEGSGGGSGDIEGVTAGNGLTGGGITGTVTLNVGATSPITVAADAVECPSCETTTGAQTKVDTHAADTTSVHGITDTSVLETTTGAQTKVDTHVNDTSAAHAATAISNAAAGNIAATTVQAAIDELDSEKAAVASAVMDGDTAGGVLAGTYPNPSFASDMATQGELDAHASDTTSIHGITDTSALETTTGAQAKVDAHVNDTTAAHAATAISVIAQNGIASTDVQSALEELQGEIGGGGYSDEQAQDSVGTILTDTATISWTYTDLTPTIEANVIDGSITAAKVAADVATQAELDAHTGDTTDAHDASAISFSPAGTIAATDVQAAIAELDSESASKTETLTNKTINAESTGNAVTIPHYWSMDMVGVAEGVPGHAWNDDPLSTTCVANAVTGTNRTTGVCTFPDSDGDYGRQITIYLFKGWGGNFDAEIWWKTTGTGNARFQFQTACYADDEADDAAFNTASIVTAAAGTSGRPNRQTITGITTTGCAAEELMRIRFFRNRTEASDTLNAALDVEKIIFKGRITHAP